MPTVTAIYQGNLRVECRHEQSGTTIVTDAPVDNRGRGEAFSPTDLCAAALGACAMTFMGLYGQEHDVDVSGTRMEITKTMSANPRRIGKIEVIFTMPDRPFSEKDKTSLERAARACAVHKSLHPDIEQVLTFRWPQ